MLPFLMGVIFCSLIQVAGEWSHADRFNLLHQQVNILVFLTVVLLLLAMLLHAKCQLWLDRWAKDRVLRR
jgi:hypothetical protein